MPDSARRAHFSFLLLLFSATTINYVDRQTLSVLAPTLRDEFHLSNSQYAAIVNSFQAAYLVMYTAGGGIADWIGVRAALALFMVWWSAACGLQALAAGFASLAGIRFLLAIGQGGMWPTGFKAVAERVPASISALGFGFVNGGSGLGALIAPPLVGGLALAFGWRAACLVCGAIGLAWTPLWLHRTRGFETADAAGGRPTRGLPSASLFRYRQTWACFFARFVGEPVWFFYIFWLPEYLSRARGLDLAAIAKVAWIPFLTALAGNFVGGGLVSWLTAQGWSAHAARRIVMTTGALGATIGIGAAYTNSLASAIACMSAATFFFICWSVNQNSLPAEFFPSRYVGTVMGFSGTGASIGTMISNAVMGLVLDRTGSYTAIILVIGMLLPLAQLVMVTAGGRIERVMSD